MNNESGNPALSEKVLNNVGALESSSTATIGGTTIKILALLIITLFGGYFGWQSMASATGSTFWMIIGASILGFGFALGAIFKPMMAGIFGPLYAVSQGYVLGAISQLYNAEFNGIVVQAIGLTGAIFFSSLWFFSLGLIKVTQKFRTGVLIATVGIAIYYLVAIVLSLFGVTAPLIFDSGAFGIAFSLFIIFIATLNLILDYDLIQRLVKNSSPKPMEWYGAFALIVTLLWLYVEVLRLLSKIRQ